MRFVIWYIIYPGKSFSLVAFETHIKKWFTAFFSSSLGPKHVVVKFVVKFFPPDHTQLQEELTRLVVWELGCEGEEKVNVLSLLIKHFHSVYMTSICSVLNSLTPSILVMLTNMPGKESTTFPPKPGFFKAAI